MTAKPAKYHPEPELSRKVRRPIEAYSAPSPDDLRGLTPAQYEAENTRIKSRLWALAHDEDATVRARVAKSWRTPGYIIDFLSADSELIVRLNAVSNYKISEHALRILLNDGNEEVRVSAKRHLEKKASERKTTEDHTNFRKEINVKHTENNRNFDNRSWFYYAAEMAFTIVQLKTFADDVDLPFDLLARFIVKHSRDPIIRSTVERGILLEPENTGAKIHRKIYPERTLERLLKKYDMARDEFAKHPEGSNERLLGAYTVISTFEALKRRGYAVDDLPGRDKVTEARRIKQATRRARAKSPA